MHRRGLVFVIHGFGVKRIPDAGERLADFGLLFGRLPQNVFEIDQCRFRRAGRSENYQVLPRKQCDQRGANDFIALDQRRC
jgi:hypothetical protein